MVASLRVGIIGATGYGGGELVRLLARHPAAEVVALQARGRSDESIDVSHPHLAGTRLRIGDELPDGLDAVFLGLPHGAAAALVPELVAKGLTVVDLGPDFRLRDAADYPRWYRFEHPRPDLLERAVYGLPELHREELAALRDADVRIVASPGCYATASILALAPL
ncbi:MAG TPA: N-acetyl-gamma-glutamyl-phosphate reductase, partial [Patescibacteria group bacterium]|nr:N-acetyl-gamma-glutamyl-phosphate reductase [Patescibacteria group bacterium]